jgi:hypothetical protein
MSIDDKTINFIEVRVCGLQRSGNHALIAWAINQHRAKSSCFLNNVRHGNHDPYKTYEEIILSGLPGCDEQSDAESLRSAQKHLLLYSYEDYTPKMEGRRDFLSSVFDPEFEENREKYLGRSEHRIDVLVLRDPFNFFASRLKRAPEERKSVELIANNWKRLARHAIAINAETKPGRIAVNFNAWLKDVEYRKQLSRELLGVHDDSSMSDISALGGGSSFDHYPLTLRRLVRNWTRVFDPKKYRNIPRYFKTYFFPPKAERLKIFERWKHFAEDSVYRRIFADRELLELSEEIFGEIPGTREFVRRTESWTCPW